jgi:hypothetical protein
VVAYLIPGRFMPIRFGWRILLKTMFDCAIVTKILHGELFKAIKLLITEHQDILQI